MSCEHAKRFSGVFGALNGCIACQCEEEAVKKKDARECARWLLPFLVNEPHHLKEALRRWTWLDQTQEGRNEL